MKTLKLFLMATSVSVTLGCSDDGPCGANFPDDVKPLHVNGAIDLELVTVAFSALLEGCAVNTDCRLFNWYYKVTYCGYSNPEFQIAILANSHVEASTLLSQVRELNNNCEQTDVGFAVLCGPEVENNHCGGVEFDLSNEYCEAHCIENTCEPVIVPL